MEANEKVSPPIAKNPLPEGHVPTLVSSGIFGKSEWFESDYKTDDYKTMGGKESAADVHKEGKESSLFEMIKSTINNIMRKP